MHLGKRLARETPADGHRLTILLSHFHWDHIQGLPFFAPLYDSRNCLYFHCFEAHGITVRDALGGLMLTPFFPVDISVMKGQKNFYTIGQERLKIFDVEIRTAFLNHPQGCLGFRIEAETGVFVYATDHEHGNAKYDAAVRELAAGTDLLLTDAQYTPAEYAHHVGWGHSTWLEATRIARDAGVKELVLFHHDPDHSDLVLDKILMEARACFPRVHAAMEGTTAGLCRRQDATFRPAIEMRHCQRVPIALPILVQLKRVGQDNEVEHAVLNDLSVDGSYFLVEHEWDIGTELDAEICVPGRGGATAEILRMRGTVARSEKVDNKTGVGVSFRSRAE
jgi:phosphoribosyl 1,2-cyclic phosphodiesterase